MSARKPLPATDRAALILQLVPYLIGKGEVSLTEAADEFDVTPEQMRGMVEKLTDPLTHLVRNSLDHGIESPADREAAGKPPVGTLMLRAFHRGGNIMIEVTDDGAGLNRERLLAKAQERGMPVSESMPDQEVYQLIFEAGFSTADKVTDVSGRGVGIDVVKRNIRSMGGNVEINSTRGAGTRITIRLPLTPASVNLLTASGPYGEMIDLGRALAAEALDAAGA